MDKPFADRVAAAKLLAKHLRQCEATDTLVLGTPSAALAVAAEVARAIGAELDVVAVRTIDIPTFEQLSVGAVVSGGHLVLERGAITKWGISPAALQFIAGQEMAVLIEEEQRCRGDRPPVDVAGRRIVLVDDGLTPTADLRAVLATLRAGKPTRLAVALPITTAETMRMLSTMADETFCAAPPEPYHSHDFWYRHAHYLTQDDVRATLDLHRLTLANGKDATISRSVGA